MTNDPKRHAHSDEAEINRLLIAYCLTADIADHAARAALFVADGRLDTPAGNAAGRPDIEALLTRLMPPGAPPRQHLLTNVLIDVDGEAATATSYVCVLRKGPSGIGVSFAGRNRDALVRTNGTWLFRSRTITDDFAGT